LSGGRRILTGWTPFRIIIDSSAVMVNPNSNTADFIFLKKYYVSINQKAFMKKIVIVFFVVFIAAVMTSTAQTAESYFAAGLEKAEKGLYKEALADFTKVIELNPKSAVAYTNRGYAKDELGDMLLQILVKR
jgi:tetratricopeptide (TPR) repeat protein